MPPASSTSPARSCGPRRGRFPSPRAMMFERATPSVVLTVFTGYLPAVASATARSVFLPARGRARLLEDLDFHRLAAQEPLQLAHPLLETTHRGSRDDRIVSAHRFLAPLTHQLPPAEDQAGRQPVAASNIADRHTGLHRFGNHGQLQLGREAPPAGDAGDHFHLPRRVGHKHTPTTMPTPSVYRRRAVATLSSS